MVKVSNITAHSPILQILQGYPSEGVTFLGKLAMGGSPQGGSGNC